MTAFEVSIVIPVFNSEDNLAELVARAAVSLNDFPYEIIFVNDGSTDKSWLRISELSAANKNITGLDLRMNSGQDNAIMAGIREASGNFVVIMDDDLQHDPSDIPVLLEHCNKGYDLCYAHFFRKKHNVIKRSGSRFNGLLARWLVKRPAGIYLSPFKIMKGTLAKEVARFRGPYPYIDGILLTLTKNIGSVEVEHHRRFSGKGNYGIGRSAGVMFRLLTGFSVLPLRYAALAGLLIAGGGFFMILYYLYEHFVLKQIVAGWTTLVILILFFGGIIIMLLGLIGEYLGRIYLAMNGKPQYSIREKIPADESDRHND